jgi:predicted nucleic acid-binding protein
MKADVFLDTAFVLALSSSSDRFHETAKKLSRRVEEKHVHIVTTRAVLIEIGDAMAKQPFRRASVTALRALELAKDLEIVPISEQLYAQAFQLYTARPDKEWGLTDCISFVVMQEMDLTEALTTDRHFEQAGFKSLMR